MSTGIGIGIIHILLLLLLLFFYHYHFSYTYFLFFIINMIIINIYADEIIGSGICNGIDFQTERLSKAARQLYLSTLMIIGACQ